jgi:hypothetical protein
MSMVRTYRPDELCLLLVIGLTGWVLGLSAVTAGLAGDDRPAVPRGVHTMSTVASTAHRMTTPEVVRSYTRREVRLQPRVDVTSAPFPPGMVPGMVQLDVARRAALDNAADPVAFLQRTAAQARGQGWAPGGGMIP